MKGKPTVAGFLSYARADDAYEKGRISGLRERLEEAIRFCSGLCEFRIFQDWQDIGFGQRWEKVIGESIENSIVLFPIVTPSFFTSEGCRKEILAFEKRQAKLGHEELILPIYYFLSEQMVDSDENPAEPEEARVAELIKRVQFEDWRALRQTEQTDPAYGQAIERLARRAIPALKRGMAANAATSVASLKPVRSMTSGAPNDAGSPTPAMSTSSLAEAEASVAIKSNLEPAGDSAAVEAAHGYVATVKVDQFPGRGDFTTISDAIARAPAGARIQIRPGHYREQLMVNKPLELVGDGPREDIVIEAEEGNALVFDTNIGVVRGLTVRQSGSKDFYGVWIKQGRLALEDCDLLGAKLSCIAISKAADPRVRHNLIHNSRQAGILVFAQGRGTYEDNEIFGNGLSGFAAKEEADPIVRRNRIHKNNGSGIHVYENGGGTFEDNEVFGNDHSGIEVMEQADPIVRRNRIRENSASGIHVYENGRGTFEDNEVFGNDYSGFVAREEADPMVRRNGIRENKQSGIYVVESGRGTFEDNEIVGNGRAGITTGSGGAPVVRRNRINKNGYEAVWVAEGGAGLYEDNDLRENTRGPWDVEASASAELKRARNIEK